MANLAADAYLETKGEAKTEKFILDTSTAQTIYKGQPMIIDQDVDTQNVRGYVDATVVAATDVFVGIAAEGKVVAAGDVEDVEIEVYVEPTELGFNSAVFDNADLGKTVYMSDSGTLSETAADNPQIGKNSKNEEGLNYIKLITPQICTGA
jgi:hypothetical protein